tara:strand:+ start:7626 stop:8069 length:444 start_codon:yes stop_codon:yes gene_type:complete
MSEQFLELLKFLFLALLYVFFIWVVIMSIIQLRKPKKPIRASKKHKDEDDKTAITHLLTIEPQDTQGAEYPLEEEIYLGRDEECGITINDSFTSHRHARIFLEEDTLYLEDLTSTNGTFVNGEKIEKPHLLEQRDRIQIGNTVLEAK